MENKTGLGTGTLIGLIVGSSIGTGVFGVCSDLANAAASGPALIAWLLCTIGVFALVLSLNNLSAKRPDLTSGLFSYADAALGPMGEFFSGWGYWLSAWLGNVAFGTFLMGAIGQFIPLFKGGQNLPSIIAAILFVWVLTWIVNRGFESASFLNTIITICKVIPLIVFIIVVLILFKTNTFTSDFWGRASTNLIQHGTNHSTFAQVRDSIIVIIWVLTGTETASVLSSRAKSRRSAQTATIMGTIMLVVIYLLISMLPYGILSQAQIAHMPQPAVASILGKLVGTWGVILVDVGLIISTIGVWLSWTMLPAETTRLMAEDKILPASWQNLNNKKAPTKSLIISATLQSIFLFSLLFTSYAYHLAYTLAAAAILISYILVGIYQFKYSYQHQQIKGLILGIILIAFEVMAIIFSWQNILALTIAYALGFIFYVRGRKDATEPLTKLERLTIIVISLVALIALILIVKGIIKMG